MGELVLWSVAIKLARSRDVDVIQTKLALLLNHAWSSKI
jgi:hypothetical protein